MKGGESIMALFAVEFQKKDGTVTRTQLSANSASEARQKMLMRSETKKVIAVVQR